MKKISRMNFVSGNGIRFDKKTAYIISIITAISLVAAGGFSCRSREQALYEQATEALDEGLSGASVEYLTTFLVKYPDSPLVAKVLFQRGTIYQIYQSRYIEAIADFRELLRSFPDNANAYSARRNIAEILDNKIRSYNKAIVEYQKLIDDFDTVVDEDVFQYRIAVCFFQLLDFEQAKLEFYKLIYNYPASPLVDDAYYQIANILQTQGALEDAEKAYNLYLARYPDGDLAVDAMFNLAATYEEMERLDEALELYNKIFPLYENKEAISWRIEKVRRRLDERGR